MKVFFVSLGCDKNLVDSEIMLGILREKGYNIVSDESEAEIIIINTCCFIHDAKEESIETILEMAAYKTRGNLKLLVVAGCLAQRYQEEIFAEIPEVDLVLGTSSFEKIAESVSEAAVEKHLMVMDELDGPAYAQVNRVVTTGGYYAYLKIAEGCDKKCTYCIIPKLRGIYRSIPMDVLLDQAEALAGQGVRELILVAQETTVYGKDLYGEKRLHLLLRKLCQVEGIRWIRVLYCYPEEIYEEMLTVMREEDKICTYLDLPIQHCDDEILRRMGRHTTGDKLKKVIKKIRDELPGICLRTTLITGFPGESEAQHEKMKDFIRDMRFERLGVFSYSREEDTAAALMPDQVSEEEKTRRWNELMEVQQEVSASREKEMLGRTLEVMIEGKLTEEEVYVGRTYMDSPDVDGFVFVHCDEELHSGDFAEVRISEALEYDLIGEVVR